LDAKARKGAFSLNSSLSMMFAGTDTIECQQLAARAQARRVDGRDGFASRPRR
jgi:hypothetical protein